MVWDGLVIVGQDGVAAETSKSGYVIVTVPEVLTRISLLSVCLNTFVELV